MTAILPRAGTSIFERTLLNNVSIGATSITLTSAPTNSPKYVIIDALTSEAEVRKVSSIVGAVVNFSGGLTFAHLAGDRVQLTDAPVVSGTAAPEGAVVAPQGTVYERTQDHGGAYVKRLGATDAFGWFPLAEKPRGGGRVWHVIAAWGSDSADGLSWGSAFATIQKAVTEAQTQGGGTVYVATGQYVETVTLTGGVRLIGLAGGEGLSGAVRIHAPSSSANCMNVSGVNVVENITLVGTTPTYTGVFLSMTNASLSVFRNVRPQGASGIVPSLTNGGTGFKINNCEGMLFESCAAYSTSLGFFFEVEASQNVIIGFRGALNWRALKMQHGGGNTVIHWKTTGTGDPVTPSEAVSLVGSDAGNNVFIECDWDEAGPNLVTVDSDRNTFIGSVSAPACLWTVSGDENVFLRQHINGAKLTVTGSRNVFDSPDLRGAGLQLEVNGSDNIVRNENKPENVAGTGFRREAFYKPGATADLQSGTSHNGYPFLAATTAPADAEIAAGECFFWFDPTDGAAKVKFKAKEAGGTVRSGEVALA